MTRIRQATSTLPTSVPSSAPPPPVAAGTVEAVIAEASAQLEEARDRSREVERESRQTQMQLRREAITHRREAAVRGLVGGIVSSAGQIAVGAMQAASASQSPELDKNGKAIPGTDQSPGLEASATITRATCDGGAELARFFQRRSENSAAAEDASAEAAAARAEDAAEVRRSAEQFQEKALRHMEGVARASHEAMMAALRA